VVGANLLLRKTRHRISHFLTAAKFGVRNGEAHKETLKHLREETGHEKLALNDSRNLGYDVADIPELLETSVLYQTQYYWIECFGPISPCWLRANA
jgi:hypothetical protein